MKHFEIDNFLVKFKHLIESIWVSDTPKANWYCILPHQKLKEAFLPTYIYLGFELD